jgi:hypothetical protein
VGKISGRRADFEKRLRVQGFSSSSELDERGAGLNFSDSDKGAYKFCVVVIM